MHACVCVRVWVWVCDMQDLCASILNRKLEMSDPHTYLQQIQTNILRIGYYW